MAANESRPGGCEASQSSVPTRSPLTSCPGAARESRTLLFIVLVENRGQWALRFYFPRVSGPTDDNNQEGL